VNTNLGLVTTKDIEVLFTYHAPDEQQRGALEAVRAAAKAFATVLVAQTPASADQTAAVRKLRECVMTANAAIVLARAGA
jgi:hypothetical protein